jgi:hypothetical protein
MSVNAIAGIGATEGSSSANAVAQAKLESDIKRLMADTAAHATQARLTADAAAVTRDQLAISQATPMTTDTYL